MLVGQLRACKVGLERLLRKPAWVLQGLTLGNTTPIVRIRPQHALFLDTCTPSAQGGLPTQKPYIRALQAAQPAYMKTNSGRVLEMPKTEEGPTTQQEMEQLSATYQATVRL